MAPSLLLLLERLYLREPRGAELGLERTVHACARFDHPERSFDAIHIAGTNGKGSVAAMVAAMARAAGLSVGLYTSPHLCRFAERIQIDGAWIEDAALADALSRVLDDEGALTFFEATTVTAFLAFAEARIDLAVVEVGLGGRLDATNVLPSPRATAITRIALDHTDWLGPDLASIALEKAGIVKAGVPLVVGPLDPEILRLVAARAASVRAPLIEAVIDESARALVKAHPPALAGPYQLDNALIAVTLARTAGLDDRAVASGLASVRWPGRMETLSLPQGTVLLDAAHNPDGAYALARALDDRGTVAARTALVFGTMADKDWRSMLALLAPRASHRFFVAPQGRRPADPHELAAAAPGRVVADVSDALAHARAAVGADGLVLVAGSIFLVGQARATLLDLPRDRAVAL